jgi:hypothetical protein
LVVQLPYFNLIFIRQGRRNEMPLSRIEGRTEIVQAGAKPVTAMQVMLEWQRDWAHRGTYDAVMDIVKNHYGAYGIGVEYAYTMVHGAPATKFPEYAVPLAAAAHK